MKYQLKAEQIVDAIQWTGENLREVQDFMTPDSPLSHDNGKRLGVNIYSMKHTYTKEELVFIDKNSWIVRNGLRQLSVLDPTSFEAMYEPLNPLETAEPDGLITHVEPGLAHGAMSDR